MNTVTIALVGALALTGAAAASAQTLPQPAAAPPAPPVGSPAEPAAGSSPAAKPMAAGATDIRALRHACRGEAEAAHLEGVERRKAVSACVVRARPDLAAREACRTRGFDMGIRKAGLRTFVEDCLKGRG